MTIDHLIALAQLVSIAGLIFQGGRFVQKFEDHVKEDNRRFDILEQQAGLSQRVQSLRRPS